MKNLLEQKFFPYVIKPGRYAGGEPGTIQKKPEGKLSYLHVFPDKYEIGQSYVGLQTLYHIINSYDRFLCERLFAVDIDAEEVLRKENIPLFSLETSREVKSFDAVGFTLSFELVYTNVLNILDLSGIPIKSKDRSEEDPIILAGGPAAYNPEPLAEFIDIFFIGDGEEGIIEILDILHTNSEKLKKEKLKLVVQQVESVYIPAFYDNDLQPLFDFVPEYVKSRIEPDLKREYYPEKPIVPLVEVVHEHLSVEIMRGCPQGCRFCQAGPVYRPVRMREINEIVELIETQMKFSGAEEVTLLSLSSSDYAEIDNLASMLARKFEPQKISVNLPSLRPGSISAKLLNAVKKVRKSGLTISAEAGTERLRQFIRKDITDEAIFDTASLAFEKGWTTIKLYFMIGLPTETDKDLDGINRIVKKINDIGMQFPGRKTINVTLSPFVPKPHTPFQWDELIPADEVLRRVTYVKNSCPVRSIQFKYPSVESALLQAIIGRGGREIGKVIQTVFENGGKFEGWNEYFDFEKWKDAFVYHDVDFEQLIKPIPFSQTLPWSLIRKGVSVEHLQKERQRTSTQLKDYTPKIRENDESDIDRQNMQFGRSKKKIVSQSVVAPTKNRVRFIWGKDSRYKYMGHLDNVKFLERIIRMAKLPVMYSQGFNPSMKLSFGPPLPLGFTSETEIIDITFETNFMPYMAEKLKEVLPDGLTIYDAKIVLSKSKSISSQLNRASYRIPVTYIKNNEKLSDRINTILSSDSLVIERQKKSDILKLDIRPAIYEMSLTDDTLYMTLGLGEGGYAKPSEVLQALLADDFDLYLTNFMHREELFKVDESGNKIKLLDIE